MAIPLLDSLDDSVLALALELELALELMLVLELALALELVLALDESSQLDDDSEAPNSPEFELDESSQADEDSVPADAPAIALDDESSHRDDDSPAADDSALASDAAHDLSAWTLSTQAPNKSDDTSVERYFIFVGSLSIDEPAPLLLHFIPHRTTVQTLHATCFVRTLALIKICLVYEYAAGTRTSLRHYCTTNMLFFNFT